MARRKRSKAKTRAAPQRAHAAKTMTAAQMENKHEHWVKKSATVAIIASVITFLGGLNLLIYSAGHITPLRASAASAPFWIAIITLFVIAVLVDYIKTSLKNVFWVEDIVGGIFGALGYAVFFAALGIAAFATIAGFVLGAIVLFVLFYVGFVAGHSIDMALKEAGVNIN
jgi:magnesium-transporting ATPase (P-type)